MSIELAVQFFAAQKPAPPPPPRAAARDSDKDITTAMLQGAFRAVSPQGGFTDGRTGWIIDDVGDAAWAFNLSTIARDSAKDFGRNSLRIGNSSSPRGGFSNRTTAWIVDGVSHDAHAFTIATRSRDSAKDFASLDISGVSTISLQGGFSDDTTAWLIDSVSDSAFAFNIATRTRDESKDFTQALLRSGNDNISPRGGFSDGVTAWIIDSDTDSVFAFNIANRRRDLAKDLSTELLRSANSRIFPTGGFANDTTIWITDSSNDAAWAFVKPTIVGRQWDKDLSQRLLLSANPNIQPSGGFSNGTTGWVVDRNADAVWAFDLATKTRDSGKDFSQSLLRSVNSNIDSRAGFANDTTAWIVDDENKSALAFDIATRARDASKDFSRTLLTSAFTSTFASLSGAFNDDTTVWIMDNNSYIALAFNIATRTRDSSKDFSQSLLRSIVGTSISPNGGFSDGTTAWIIDSNNQTAWAFTIATMSRDSDKDIKRDMVQSTIIGGSSPTLFGGFTDKSTAWLLDSTNDTAWAFALPTV